MIAIAIDANLKHITSDQFGAYLEGKPACRKSLRIQNAHCATEARSL
jgi:hypothetical protein